MKDTIIRKLPTARDIGQIGKSLRKRLPGHPAARAIIGLGLIAGGTFSFLPLLGIWMLPVGFVVLSVDFPRVRRWRRIMEVRLLRRNQIRALA